MPLSAPDFDLLFADGTHHIRPDGRVVTIGLREGASLWLPSGRVVADDAGRPDDSAGGFVQQVPPGRYPVVLVLGVFHARGYLREHEEVVAARLVIRDEPAVSWEMAVYEGQDVGELGEEEFFGYAVDSGTGCFADVASIAELYQDFDDYFGRLSALEAGGTMDPATLTDDQGRPVLVAFTSGGGDGHYPTWVGRTGDGEIACFLTDFGILTDTQDMPSWLDESPASGRPDTAVASTARVAESLTRKLVAGQPVSPGHPVTPSRTTTRRTVAKPSSPPSTPDEPDA